MTHIDIHIKTDNAAFQAEGPNGEEYAPGQETARILREVADNIEANVPLSLTLLDFNGHKVGTLTHKDNDQVSHIPTDDQRRIAYLEAKLEDLEKENIKMKEKLSRARADLSEWLS